MSSITLVTGRNGGGKTSAVMQYFVIPSWRVGRPVVSNITLYPEELGLPEDLYIQLGDPLEDLLRIGRHVKNVCMVCEKFVRFDVCRTEPHHPVLTLPRMDLRDPEFRTLYSITGNRGCGLVMDEVLTMFSSRESQTVPAELVALLNQWRKPDVAPVVATGVDWMRADVVMRETVGDVMECRPAFPALQHFLGLHGSARLREWAGVKAPQGPGGWWEYGWFRRDWFNAEQYEAGEESVTAKRELRPYRSRHAFSRREREAIRAVYDTSEGVQLADHQKCPECGGRRTRGACKDPVGHAIQAHNKRARVLASYLTPRVREHAQGIIAAAEQDARGTLKLLEGVPSDAA